MLVDARGVVLGLAVGPANRHDLKLAVPTLESVPVHRPQPQPHRPQHVYADKAYHAEDFRRWLARHHYRVHIPVRGEACQQRRHQRRGKRRRWVNERTQSWFHRFRRAMIRWEKKASNYEAVLMFVAAWIAFRTAGVLG